MAVLEIHTFHIVKEMTAPEFRSLDERMQEWCYVNRAGLARRTTARSDDGQYVVVTLFGTQEQANNDYLATAADVAGEWKKVIDWNTSSRTSYSLL